MRRDLKEIIKKAYEVPEPTNKEIFIKRFRLRKINLSEMIMTQAGYIRKTVWLFSGMIVLISLLGVYRFSEDILEFIGMILPFSAVLGILETYRSFTHKMNELEQASRFSLRSVLYARLLIIGIMNTVVILISASILSSASSISIIFVTAKLMIPYLLTMVIGLHIERTVYGRNNSYLSIAVAVTVSLLTFGIDVLGVPFIIVLSESVTITIAGVLLMLTVWEMIRTIRTTEVYV